MQICIFSVAEIRFRAERRLGEMIAAQKDAGLLNKGASAGGTKDGSRGVCQTPRDDSPTLAEAGIDKNLAKRARKYAAIPEARFESLLAEHRKNVERLFGQLAELSSGLLTSGKFAALALLAD